TADVRVAALSDALVLDVDVRARDAFVHALEQLLVADDVELSAPAEPTVLIAVDGPGAAATLATPAAVELAPFAHVEASVAGVPVRVVRASEVRGAGYVLHVPAGAGGGGGGGAGGPGCETLRHGRIGRATGRGRRAADRSRHGREDAGARGPGRGCHQHHEGLLSRPGGGRARHGPRAREPATGAAGANRSRARA